MLRKFAFLGGGIASIALSTLSIALDQPVALAACLIPDGSVFPERPYNQADVVSSFLNSNCTAVTLSADTVFFRYFSFVNTPPNLNIGRFLTDADFSVNSDAIVQLALAPFTTSSGTFQNLATFRETVTVLAGTTLYVGTVGPQPPSNPNSCYAGGATQYFFADPTVDTNNNIKFEFGNNLTNAGDPCVNIPEPSPLIGLSAMAALGLAAIFQQTARESAKVTDRSI